MPPAPRRGQAGQDQDRTKRTKLSNRIDVEAAQTAANAVTNPERRKILQDTVQELRRLRRVAGERASREEAIRAREREFQKSRRVTLPHENQGVILPEDVQVGDILKLKDGRVFKLRDGDVLEQISD